MILVVLGTQDKRFERLIALVDEALKNGWIHEDVIVQAGCTKYSSAGMKIVDFVDMSEFEQWMNECRILITHGGVGTIMSALRLRKPVIACARLAKYGEHHNDHQCEIIENFFDKGLLIQVKDGETLERALQEAETFSVPEVESNNQKMLSLLADYLEI
ncbi:MAG: beta(1,3)galactosyltransferase EpsH [Erysipelotrichaceae bacterium]|nr:beta(1,3)galactosyltransferase EpsH [Erysipelotrichaceae bacterium]